MNSRPFLTWSVAVFLFVSQVGFIHAARADELADQQRWQALETKGDFRGALAAANSALAASIKAHGRESDETIRVLSELTRLRHECGDYQGSRDSGMQALALHEKLHPEKPSAVAALTRFYLGRGETIQRDYAVARKSIEASLQYFEEHEPDHPALSQVLREYAFFLAEDADSKRSIEVARRAVALATKKFGAKAAETALCRERLGFALFRSGDLSEAEVELKAALDSLTESLGKDHPHVGMTVYHLAWLTSDFGRYEEQNKLLIAAHGILQKSVGDEHILTSYAWNDRANYLFYQGELATAKSMYTKTVEVRKKMFGPQHPQLINVYTGLSAVYVETKDHYRSKLYLDEAYKIGLQSYGPEHERFASLLATCADRWKRLGEYELALKCNRDALKIAEAKRGPEHPMTISCRHQIAWLLSVLGRPKEADELHRQTITSFGTRFGESHPFTIRQLRTFGHQLLVRGDLKDAQQQYELALQRATATYPADAREVIESRESLAEIWMRQDKWPEAIAAVDQARRAQKGAAAQALLGMTESEVLSYLESKHNTSSLTPITLATVRGKEQAAIDSSASWHLNRKALRWAVLGERTQLARQVHDPAAQELRQQLAAVREKLATVMFRPAPVTITSLIGGDVTSEHSRLSQEADVLTAQLARTAGKTANSTKWIELAEVRKFIPQGAVLIEFAHEIRSELERTDGKDMPFEFGAWIIPAADAGEIRFVNLGGVLPILEAIGQARWAIQASAGAFMKEPEKTEPQLKEFLAKLSAKLFAPLEPHLKDCDRLIISPDGQLWTVPWSTLITADKKYAVEKYTISLVASGRDLLRAPRNEKLTSAVVVSDPEYNAGAKGEDVSAEFTRLPGSAREAQEITPVLKKLVGAEPKVLVAKDATESAVKETRDASILVLSTHGWFREISSNSRINPYLCCGLAFRGANQKAAIPTSNDGLLTGLEILNLDLSHTQLVVLSACNSGVGQVNRGDGVSGLVQAFQLAGAESVLASLWPVADEETATLVSHFFREYAELKSETPAREATALRQAQLAMIKEQREKQKATHPFFWSAFTLNAATH